MKATLLVCLLGLMGCSNTEAPTNTLHYGVMCFEKTTDDSKKVAYPITYGIAQVWFKNDQKTNPQNISLVGLTINANTSQQCIVLH